jgi:hypothetical protein
MKEKKPLFKLYARKEIWEKFGSCHKWLKAHLL